MNFENVWNVLTLFVCGILVDCSQTAQKQIEYRQNLCLISSEPNQHTTYNTPLANKCSYGLHARVLDIKYIYIFVCSLLYLSHIGTVNVENCMHQTLRHTQTPNTTKLNLICMKLLAMGRQFRKAGTENTHQNNYSNSSKNVIYLLAVCISLEILSIHFWSPLFILRVHSN